MEIYLGLKMVNHCTLAPSPAASASTSTSTSTTKPNQTKPDPTKPNAVLTQLDTAFFNLIYIIWRHIRLTEQSLTATTSI